MTYVSANFTLQELIRNDGGIPNEPGAVEVWALRILCVAVLEPWRRLVGAIRITSGFRNRRVNRAAGGEDDSQHLRGEAVDCIPVGLTGWGNGGEVRLRAWAILIELAEAGIPVDQAIIYEQKGHIHVSCTHTRLPRRQFLVDVGDNKTVPWATYDGPLRSVS